MAEVTGGTIIPVGSGAEYTGATGAGAGAMTPGAAAKADFNTAAFGYTILLYPFPSCEPCTRMALSVRSPALFAGAVYINVCDPG